MDISLMNPEDRLYLQKFKTAISESDDEVVKSDMKYWTDEILLMFLRCRNYDIESAIERIHHMVMTIRKTHVEIFKEIYPSRLQYAFDIGVAEILKNRDYKGRRVLIYRYCNWDPNKICVDDVMACIILLGMQMLHEIETQTKGFIVIWDVAGLNFYKASHITPPVIKKYITFANNANPMKLKAMHVLNAPRIFNVILSVIKMFVSKKFSKRLIVHGSSLESLHHAVSPDILPTYLGGKLSNEDAMDHQIVPQLCTKEQNEFYMNFFALRKNE